MLLYTQGTVVIREGEMSSSLFILQSGRVGIYKNDLKIAENDEAGTLFGEMSLILGRPRTATVIAETDCVLHKIEGNIDILIRNYPEIAKKLLYNLANSLDKANEEQYHLYKENIQIIQKSQGGNLPEHDNYFPDFGGENI